ncbi:serine/threonine-protein kinase, partial [Alienimonas chondri]|uniref:Serine/threonine-protein kinase PknD n=1 Tax=Alienimonas chondri TaxID=2681879 RepID=A0ABX1VI03_9PLAN
MGVVYLAEDTELGRTVALKVLPKREDMAPNLIARFRSEARAAARLHHPGIVTVFDSGETDKALYIALEYVDGNDVDRLLKTRERLPPRRATDLVRQIGEALVHLHEKGIVHRDIKPSNIMVRRDGSAVLADLGLAIAIESSEGGITRAGYTVGTVDYMAPEQAKNSRDADVRSDLYSLACSWFHMLTGRIPFEGESLTAKLAAHDRHPVPDPRSIHDDIPDSYTAVLQRAMAKKPEDRYATPQEFLDDLELAHKRRGHVSSDLLKDLAAGDSDDDFVLGPDDAEAAKAVGTAESETAETDDVGEPVRRRRKKRRPGKPGVSPRRRPAAGEVPAGLGDAADDSDDSNPRRRKPAGAAKDYNKGVDPLLIRNLLIGGVALALLIGGGMLVAHYSGAFGGVRIRGPGDDRDLAAALARLPAKGGTITLRGLGPFTLPRFDLPQGANVFIRAEGERAPIVNAAAMSTEFDAWLRIRGGSLTLDGLHVVMPEREASEASPALLDAAAATVAIRGGSVTALGDAPAIVARASGSGKTAAHVLLDGAVVRGNALTGVSLAGGPSDLFADGCLLACGDAPAVAFPPHSEAVLPNRRGVPPAAEPTPAPRGGGRINFISYRTPTAPSAAVLQTPAPPARSARLVNCTGVFRRSVVTVVPGTTGPLAVTLAECAFGASPGDEGASLLSPSGAAVEWTIRDGVLAGLAMPEGEGLEANGRSTGWKGEPIANFAALDPNAFSAAGLNLELGAASATWKLPAPATAARASAARRLPTDPPSWESLYPDGKTVEAEGTRAANVLRENHPDGTTVVVSGVGRMRLEPVSVSGRALRIIGRTDDSGDAPILAAATGAGGTPTLESVGGRLELVNLTLEVREDRTGAGPLVSADGPESLIVIRRCELRAGSGDAPAVRVRRGAARLSGVLLVGEGEAGLMELDHGAATLSHCGFVTPGPAFRFGPDGTGVVGLTRCAIAAGGPVFDASEGDAVDGTTDAAAITDRCLFLPPPPGGPGRVSLSAGGAIVWGAANAFATAYAPPAKLGDGPPGPVGGEFDLRTGPSAVVLERPRVPDWKTVTPADLAPAAGSAAATDGLGAGDAVGPSPDLSPEGGASDSTKDRDSRLPRRSTPGPDF